MSYKREIVDIPMEKTFVECDNCFNQCESMSTVSFKWIGILVDNVELHYCCDECFFEGMATIVGD